MNEHTRKVMHAIEILLSEHRIEWIVDHTPGGTLIVGEKEYPGRASEIHFEDLGENYTVH